jgi:NADH dehydrogenase (ubiquinone) 1 beta subcomplex subunit 7
MEDGRLPLYTRDFCAHVLLRLNQCRFETFYLPWKCTEKRNAYLRCEAEEFVNCVSLFVQLSTSLLTVSVVRYERRAAIKSSNVLKALDEAKKK